MKLNSYILPGILGVALLFSACGNSDQKTENPDNKTEQVKKDAPKEESQTKADKSKGMTQKEMTSEVGLDASQIDSLYNTDKIDADGKDRYVNSLTALEYLSYDDDAELFSDYAQREARLRSYLEKKNGIVVFVPNDSYIEGLGNDRILMDVWNEKDSDAMTSILKGHVYILQGKYVGGDFIYVKDMNKGDLSQVSKKGGEWNFKMPVTSDPILVKNGIIFKVDGLQLPKK